MKKDIENRDDIELLVNVFYEKIIVDKLLGNIFQNIAKVNWKKHLPVMYDFFENIILFTGKYDGNPMNLHRKLHDITQLNTIHFNKWNHLFICTVDELFEGKNANLAKERAVNISNIIKGKLLKERQ